MDQPSRIHSISMLPHTSKREIYNVWSYSYDTYVSEQQYTGPRELVSKLSTMILNFNHQIISVLDFGCGTGLVGQEIKRLGLPIKLDGLDISPKMLELAKEKDCYQNLYELNLLEENISSEKGIKKYGIIVSCGVFLEGHAPLEIIEKLLDHLQIEGFLLFTIRESYLEEQKEKFKKIVLENLRVKVLESQEIDYLKDVKCQMFLLYRTC